MSTTRYRIYQMLTDKIPCGFTTVEVRSIGYKYVWLRQYRTGKYGLKPKRYRKIERDLWDKFTQNQYFEKLS